MTLFDVSKYETPKSNDVDMEKTKYNVGIFMNEYLSVRSRCMQPREPKVTSSFSLVPPTFSNENYGEAESLLIQKEEAMEEMIYLHGLFEKGFSAIQQAFKKDISDRRKKIFYDRYVLGYSLYVTSERHHVSEDTVFRESNKAIVQFASALELVEFR